MIFLLYFKFKKILKSICTSTCRKSNRCSMQQALPAPVHGCARPRMHAGAHGPCDVCNVIWSIMDHGRKCGPCILRGPPQSKHHLLRLTRARTSTRHAIHVERGRSCYAQSTHDAWVFCMIQWSDIDVIVIGWPWDRAGC